MISKKELKNQIEKLKEELYNLELEFYKHNNPHKYKLGDVITEITIYNVIDGNIIRKEKVNYTIIDYCWNYRVKYYKGVNCNNLEDQKIIYEDQIRSVKITNKNKKEKK